MSPATRWRLVKYTLILSGMAMLMSVVLVPLVFIDRTAPAQRRGPPPRSLVDAAPPEIDPSGVAHNLLRHGENLKGHFAALREKMAKKREKLAAPAKGVQNAAVRGDRPAR